MPELLGAHCSHTKPFKKKRQNVNASTRMIRVKFSDSSMVQKLRKAQLTTITITYSDSAAIFRTSPVADFCILNFAFYRRQNHMAETCYSSLSQFCYYYEVPFTKDRFVVDTTNISI